MIYAIRHSTSYDYGEPVTVSHHTARVKPRESERQRVLEYRLAISPQPSVLRSHTDYFGNELTCFSMQEIHARMNVLATSTVAVDPTPAPDLDASLPWDEAVKIFSDPVAPDAVEPYQFVFESPLVRRTRELADYARPSFPQGAPILLGARDLTRRIFADFEYDQTATNVSTPLEEVLETRRGVCQDFAHFAIGCIRSLGLPARYVSGYLRTLPPDGASALIGSSASHAWLSIYCPVSGWIDLDPTNDLLPSEDHITLAHGRDFSDVSPLSGILTGGGRHSLSVAVDVRPIETK